MKTKKRILFVDDEPMILQGLQRMLRNMRGEWDMGFAESGDQALDMMAENPYEVIVSDMRMPGMSGAELLNEIMRLYPGTIRLILSGHADKDLLLQCVGSTHQYLSKPCDPESLRATLQRATALEGSLSNASLKRLVSQMNRLPSIPSVYTEIVEKLQTPDTAVDEVGRIIAQDMGMTATILKLINSAFFGLRREVVGPTEAVAYLGLDMVKALVLSVNAFSQYEDVRIEGFSLAALWDHSLATATAAKAIAGTEHSDRKIRDEAFVAGVLHDAGKLVLACNFASQYTEVLRLVGEGHGGLLSAERQVFGASHADVGGYLLGLWGLPVSVVEAIALHHNPGCCPCKTFSPLTALHVADALLWEQSNGSGHGAAAPLDVQYLASLGLSDRLDVWRAAIKDNVAQAA
jgi:HD-like signal output (HDOD) protein/CheY-like chemotaxis protein